MQTKKRNVKRKNVQTGKGASVIAYKNYLKNILCAPGYKKKKQSLSILKKQLSPTLRSSLMLSLIHI